MSIEMCIEGFMSGYLEFAAWAEDLEDYEWSSEALEAAFDECSDFVLSFNHLFDLDECSNAGHDFWLTRNGHGAGFWDGDWDRDYQGSNVGELLSIASRLYGEATLYVGDDDLLYFA